MCGYTHCLPESHLPPLLLFRSLGRRLTRLLCPLGASDIDHVLSRSRRQRDLISPLVHIPIVRLRPRRAKQQRLPFSFPA
jgi:hypothetical protein